MIEPAIVGKPMIVLVAGGADVIGIDFVLDWLAQFDEPVIDRDELTYSGLLCANFPSATIDYPVQGQIALPQLAL